MVVNKVTDWALDWGLAPGDGIDMKTLGKFFAAGAAVAALLAGASGASAAIVIGYSETATPPAAANYTSGTVVTSNGFTITSISAGQGSNPFSLLSDDLETSFSGTKGAKLYVFVTDMGITAPTGPTGDVVFTSSFTENTLNPNWTVNEYTYVDTSNGMFTTPAAGALSSFDFNSANTASGHVGPSPIVVDKTVPFGSPYSVTEEYVITAGGAGTVNGTIDLSAVPEPATWAMMLLGVGMVGAGLRSSRRGVSLAAA